MKNIFNKINKVDTGCWEWTGTLRPDGYGVLYVEKKQVRAHRYVYEQLVGPIPSGKSLLHSCDNPSCVNPSHLSPGSQTENLMDMRSKNRGMRGEMYGASILTEKNVIAMRQEAQYCPVRNRLKNGERKRLASKYGVSEQTVADVIMRRRWAWLE